MVVVVRLGSVFFVFDMIQVILKCMIQVIKSTFFLYGISLVKTFVRVRCYWIRPSGFLVINLGFVATNHSLISWIVVVMVGV